MNLEKLFSIASFTVGLFAVVLLYRSGETQNATYLIGFWVVLFTLNLFLIIKPYGSWLRHNWPSVVQAISAIAVAVLTGLLWLTTHQYTQFTGDMKKFQQENFIFSELRSAGFEPLVLDLQCSCVRTDSNGAPRYQCSNFTLFLTNNTSVDLSKAWVDVYARARADHKPQIHVGEEKKSISRLSPNEDFLLTDEFNKGLGKLNGDIDTVDITAEYYTPTNTMFTQRASFSFPTCQRIELKGAKPEQSSKR